jgi:hypothetical protein
MYAKKFWIALLVFGFLGSIALAGYFLSRGPVYGEIAGCVTRGGAPLEQVQVVFYSEENGPRSLAVTDQDGHFETMTDGIQNVPARKGAPVGKYPNPGRSTDGKDHVTASNPRATTENKAECLRFGGTSPRTVQSAFRHALP